MNLSAKLEHVDLARQIAQLERKVDRAFDRLMAAKVGDPLWRQRNDELFTLEQELTALRARAHVVTAGKSGGRHLKLVR